jgi:hypothetical protein
MLDRCEVLTADNVDQAIEILESRNDIRLSSHSAVLMGYPKISPAGAGLTLFLGSKIRQRITFLRHRSRCRRLRSD